jgi:hypothetical protein
MPHLSRSSARSHVSVQDAGGCGLSATPTTQAPYNMLSGYPWASFKIKGDKWAIPLPTLSHISWSRSRLGVNINSGEASPAMSVMPFAKIITMYLRAYIGICGIVVTRINLTNYHKTLIPPASLVSVSAHSPHGPPIGRRRFLPLTTRSHLPGKLLPSRPPHHPGPTHYKAAPTTPLHHHIPPFVLEPSRSHSPLPLSSSLSGVSAPSFSAGGRRWRRRRRRSCD